MRSSAEARVIWLPQDDTSAIVLGAQPDILSTSADRQPTIDTTTSVDADGETFLVFDLGNGQRVRGNIHRIDFRFRESIRAGDGDAAAAGAHIKDVLRLMVN